MVFRLGTFGLLLYYRDVAATSRVKQPSELFQERDNLLLRPYRRSSKRRGYWPCAVCLPGVLLLVCFNFTHLT